MKRLQHVFRARPAQWWTGRALGLAMLVFATGAPAQTGSPVVTQHQLQMVEHRLERVEQLVESGVLTDMLQSVDALQGEVRQLRGQVEQLENELRTLRTRQRDQFQSLDERLGLVEGGAAARPPAEPEPGPDRRPDTPQADASEQDAYEAAFDQLMAGENDAAILQFERFMERFPDGVHAANALYWLAEAKYANRDYEAALVDFEAILERFPGSDKAGDATLKIGYSHFELGNTDAAREALQAVVAEHPGTTLSRLAQDRLRRLDGP
jgi:tol-pal system protein YbgF